MIIDIDYKTFCDRYFEAARKAADDAIAWHVKKYGALNPAIDVELVKDLGVSYGLEKAYNTYDVDHESKAKVRTYLSFVVRNCVLTELRKEVTAVGAKKRIDAPIDIFQGREYLAYSRRFEKKEELIAQLMQADQKLSGVDQIIIHCWMLYPKGDYIKQALSELGLEDTPRTRNMVSVRCLRSMEMLKKQMAGVRSDYRDIYVPIRRKDASDQKPESADYNFVRRRQRAAKKSITDGIDYDGMTKALGDILPENI